MHGYGTLLRKVTPGKYIVIKVEYTFFAENNNDNLRSSSSTSNNNNNNKKKNVKILTILTLKDCYNTLMNENKLITKCFGVVLLCIPPL